MHNTMKWPTNMINSMYITPFSILNVTEWCQLVHNTYSKLVSTSLIQICTFVPKLLSGMMLESEISWHGRNMVDSMNDIQFSISDVTEWCQLVHHTFSKLVSTSLIQIYTFIPKLSSKLLLACTIPWNGQQILLIQCMSLNFQS